MTAKILPQKDLITIDETTALEVFTQPDGLESAIQQIEKTARSIVPDVSTDKGRKSIRSSAARIASGKVQLDNLGKAVAAEAKATVKLIDGNRRVVRDRLDSLKVEIRAPLTEFEDAEKDRIHVIRNKMEQIESLGVIFDDHGDPLDIHTLEANLRLLNSYTVNKDMFGEFERAASDLRESNVAALEDFIAKEKESIAKDVELERLRQEAEDRKKQEYEAELKRKAAEDARLEAERKAHDDSVGIEYEKQEAVRQKDEAKRQAEASEKARVIAVQMAKDAAADAEQRRLDGIEQAKHEEMMRQEQAKAAQQAKDEARAADLNHAKQVRIDANDSLIKATGISPAIAYKVISAISQKLVTNVTINY